MNAADPIVAVIGAGCSGLTAIKNLLQAGVRQVVCFEKNDQVGGNWIYTAKESHSSVCETTHIISSKSLSEFEDFLMPEDYPDYPSHRQVLAYFQAYARHFGLEKYIRFNTAVERVEKAEGERWRLHLSTGEEAVFDYLLVANGHHSVPRHPELPGTFEGEYLHAHSYKTNAPFRGKRVLVVGAGNSGCDCAVEISRVAAFTAISIRRPTYIIPKFLLGRPTDTFNQTLTALPQPLRMAAMKLSLFLQVGSYRRYGLEEPDYPVTMAHPTLNSELLYKIRHGDVHPRRAIKAIEGRTVWFQDGVAEEFDVLLAATGYKIAFPFFSKDFIDWEDAERVPLYLRIFHPEHPTLFFIGLLQPQGCIWPLSDAQSKLVANLIMGRWQLPPNLRELAEKEADEIARQFLPSKRHSIEVHYHPYLRKLKKLLPKDAPAWGDLPIEYAMD
ncbi:MAG: monooxygenase [Bacteroidetes bacterium]|nr:MAG: monooxygenase [Bacteroidota bacterium]